MKPRFLPKFPIFVQDIRGSLRWQMMSAEERGGYVELLFIQWIEGGLPNNWPALLALAKVSGSPPDHPLLVDAFDLGDDCLLRNPKCASVRAEAEAYCDSQSAAGARGNAKRWGRDRVGIGSGIGSGSPPTPTPTPTPNSDNPPNPLRGEPPAAAPAAKKAKPKKKTADVDAELFDKPDWLKLATREWLAYRTEKGLGAYTPSGLRDLVAEISEMGEGRFRIAARHSRSKDYTGLFEPKTNGFHAAPAPSIDEQCAGQSLEERQKRIDEAEERYQRAISAQKEAGANGRI